MLDRLSLRVERNAAIVACNRREFRPSGLIRGWPGLILIDADAFGQHPDQLGLSAGSGRATALPTDPAKEDLTGTASLSGLLVLQWIVAFWCCQCLTCSFQKVAQVFGSVSHSSP